MIFLVFVRKNLLAAGPDVVLNKDLSTLAGIDAIRHVLKEVVDDVTGSETERWGTRVEIPPVVVGICYCEMALVFGTVAVRMTNERALEMVMHESVGDGDEIAGVGNVQEAVVEVLLTVVRNDFSTLPYWCFTRSLSSPFHC